MVAILNPCGARTRLIQIIASNFAVDCAISRPIIGDRQRFEVLMRSQRLRRRPPAARPAAPLPRYPGRCAPPPPATIFPRRCASGPMRRGATASERTERGRPTDGPTQQALPSEVPVGRPSGFDR